LIYGVDIQGMKYGYKICVSGAAEIDICSPKTKELAIETGREIVRQGAILITGATSGIPYLSAVGAKEEKGFSIGFSPASTEKEHIKSYRLPTDKFDLIVYTGFDYAGRNLLMTRAADAVIIIGGRTGTMNEFTVAFEDEKPIGVLEGSGGTADLIRILLKHGYRPRTTVVYDTEPKKLVKKVIQLIQREKKINNK